MLSRKNARGSTTTNKDRNAATKNLFSDHSFTRAGAASTARILAKLDVAPMRESIVGRRLQFNCSFSPQSNQRAGTHKRKRETRCKVCRSPSGICDRLP